MEIDRGLEGRKDGWIGLDIQHRILSNFTVHRLHSVFFFWIVLENSRAFVTSKHLTLNQGKEEEKKGAEN